MDTEYRKIKQRQGSRATLEAIKRDQFLAFDTDQDHLIYCPDGVSYFDFYNSGEIEAKFTSAAGLFVALSGASMTGQLNAPSVSATTVSASFYGPLNGNASTSTSAAQADKLKNSQTFTIAGDVTATGQAFNGTAGVTLTTTLPNITTAGTYTKTVVNAKGQVTSGGSLVASDIPALDASKITTGTLDVARIPVLPSQIQITSTGDLTALTSAQTSAIGQGTVVTTTDGFRWVYSGSGSKTVSGSYVQLSDISPDWTTISNRPTAVSYWTNDSGYLTNASSLSWSKVTGTPTTLAGYGVAASDSLFASINAGTATKLQTARTIAGVSFDGSANIAIPYANLTGLPTLGTLAAKSTVTWTSDITGLPTSISNLGNASVHGGLKIGNVTVGGWHGIEFSDPQTTRILINDAAGGNVCGFYDATNGWLMSFNRSKQLVDGWVPWARLQNVPSTFAPSAHNQAWSTITGTPTTLAGYGITDAATSGHNHNTTYQPLENQRLSIDSGVRFSSVTTTAAVNVGGQLGVTGFAGFDSNVTVTGYVAATKFVTNGGTNQTLVLGDGTLRSLSDFASSSSLGSYALSSHTHTQIEISNTNEIVVGNGFNNVAGKLYVNWRGAGTNRISDYMLCDGKGAGVFSYITAAGFKLNGGTGNNLLSDNGSSVAMSSFALAGHNHNSAYAPLVHNHDSAYFKLAPVSTQTVSGASTIFTSPIEARGTSLFVGDVALSDGAHTNAALEVSRSTNNNTYHAGIGFHNAGNNAAYLYYSNSTGKFRFRRNSPDDLGLWDSSDFSSTNIGQWNTAWNRIAGGRLCEDTYTGEDALSWISRMGRGNHWGRINGVHGAPPYFNYMLMRETTGTVYGAIGYAADGNWYVGSASSNANLTTYSKIWTNADFSSVAVNRINNSDNNAGYTRLYRSDAAGTDVSNKYYLRHGWTTGQWYGNSWRMTCANDHADSQSGINTVAVDYSVISLKSYSLIDSGKYQSNLDTGFKNDSFGLWAGSIDAPTGTTPFGSSWTWLQEWGHSDGGWRAQMGIHYFSDSLAYRRKANGTWQPWKYVVTTDSVGTISNKIESPRITSQRSLITVAGTYQVDTLNDTIVVLADGVTLRGFVMDGVVTIYNTRDTGVIYDNNGSIYFQQGAQRTASITIPARRCLIIRGGARSYPHVSLD